jgi:fluoride ion exporter CrcB/FEX
LLVLGAIGRFLLGKKFNNRFKSMPTLGTFIANMIGTLLLSILIVLCKWFNHTFDRTEFYKKNILYIAPRNDDSQFEIDLTHDYANIVAQLPRIVGVGFCGSLTTVSSFLHECCFAFDNNNNCCGGGGLVKSWSYAMISIGCGALITSIVIGVAN